MKRPLPAQPIDPPTITVTFGINDSPLAGREGKKVQSRVIRERLLKEAESNVAIKISETPGGEAFEVAGRGELQMGVLIENMRREGFELSISRPQVLMREGDNGERLEPIEEVTIDVDDEYSGTVIEKITGTRKGDLAEMNQTENGKTRIIAPCSLARINRILWRVLNRHAGNRRVEPGVPRMGTVSRNHTRPPRRCFDFDGERRLRCLCALESRRAGPDVYWRASPHLSGYDYRRT